MNRFAVICTGRLHARIYNVQLLVSADHSACLFKLNWKTLVHLYKAIKQVILHRIAGLTHPQRNNGLHHTTAAYVLGDIIGELNLIAAPVYC